MREAETQLRKLLAIDPNNNNAQVQLVRVLAAEGKTEEAAASASAVKSDSPNDPRTALELGTMYVKANKYPEAEQQFRNAVRGCRRTQKPTSRWVRC